MKITSHSVLAFSILLVSFIFFGNIRTVHAEEILKDTKFANGFGACFWLGANYNPGPDLLKKGLCNSYVSTPGYTVKVLPDYDPAKTVAQNNENKYWEFNNGIHQDYVQNGQTVADLFIHHLAVNSTVVTNNPSNMTIEQRNSNNQLIKQVATDKNGKIYMFYNSQREFRNAAYKYDAIFAKDTWPTFQISQNFREYIDLATYDHITLTLKPRIISWTKIPGWPYEGQAGVSPPEMALNLYTFLRERNNPFSGVFIGMALYSDNTAQYEPLAQTEQNGQPFFRDNVALYGGPAVPNQYKTITIDYLALVDKGLQFMGKTGKTHNDYVLSNVDIGYEGMGWYESAFDLVDLSMTGTPDHQTDTPPAPQNSVPGDCNGDGHVTIYDYTILVQEYGKTGAPGFSSADFDKDGDVDVFDYNTLVGNFGV